ncbi:MAG: hypothetical protein PX634_03420 [Microcystis sp. M53600_WE12]|nr:hypothetical protein [Microcystis sp. M53600_WE12]
MRRLFLFILPISPHPIPHTPYPTPHYPTTLSPHLPTPYVRNPGRRIKVNWEH